MSTSTTKTEVGSYFISNYPPFSAWSPDQLGEVRAAMNAPPADVPLGLYLHIPFCRKRCKFCYFKVFTDKNSAEVERYLAALSREIELVSKLPVMGGRPFRFVYFGGGTPSFLSSRQLERLVDRLRANVSWDKAEEVTFECEPGTLSEAKVHTLREIGVTRLSLGVEHFDDAILRENGRAHESPEIYKAWPWIQAAGFANTNIDLIAGMVGETWDKWRDAVRPRDRARCRQRHDLPDGAAVQHGVLEGHSGRRDRNAGRRLGDEAGLGRLRVRRARGGRLLGLQRVHDGQEPRARELQLPRQPVARQRPVGHRHRQLRPHLGRPLPESSGVGTVLRHAGSGRAAAEPRHAHLAASAARARNDPAAQARLSERRAISATSSASISSSSWSDVWAGYEQDELCTIDQSGDRIELTREGLLQVDSLLPAFFEPQFQGVRYT